jgi:hypothetical protein
MRFATQSGYLPLLLAGLYGPGLGLYRDVAASGGSASPGSTSDRPRFGADLRQYAGGRVDQRRVDVGEAD